jgi:outer membrane protein assembly factor BamB
VLKASFTACAVAGVLLAAIGCGTSGGRAAAPRSASMTLQVLPAVTPTAAAPQPTATRHDALAGPGPGASCPARHAYAADVIASGHKPWLTRLPTAASDPGIILQPVIVAGTAVFAEYNGLYALRVSDGRQLWHTLFPVTTKNFPFGDLVYGMWAWHGLLTVLVGQVGDHARLAGIDLTTGITRWTLPLGKSGLLGAQAASSNGVLGMLTPGGTLEAADMATGKILWSRHTGHSGGPVATGTVIEAAEAGAVAGFDARTGALTWRVTGHGLPAQPNLSVADGLVLTTSAVVGPGQTTAVIALDFTARRVAWVFDTGMTPGVAGGGPAGIVAATYYKRTMNLLSTTTGRPRWSAATFVPAGISVPPDPGQLVVTATDVITVEGDSSTALVDRAAATGHVRWWVGLPTDGQLFHVALVALPSGTAIAATWAVGGGARPGTAFQLRMVGTGRLLAATTLPSLEQSPLAVTGTSVLVQLDDPGCAVPLSYIASAHSSH